MDGFMIFSLLGASAIAGAAPGPCILLVASCGAIGGRWSGLRVTFGVVLSSVVLIAVAWGMILGALSVSNMMIDWMRLGGLVVLLVLGVILLRAPVEAGARRGGPPFGDVTSGFGLGLSNPLQLLFMFALLPQFVDISNMAASHVASATLAVLFGIAAPMVVVAIGTDVLLRPFRMRAHLMTRGCGAALLGFAGLAAFAAN